VGISGREGLQAARAADYSIGSKTYIFLIWDDNLYSSF
jgi:hypothetical protein